MRPHRSLQARENVDEILSRLATLQPTSVRQWGTMTPHEMVCHLADSFLSVLGERATSRADTWLSRHVIKWVALHTSLPWPQGVPTRPEVDPKRAGTKPVEFERDRARVAELIERFARADTQYGRHPGFGEMTRDEWLLWGYGHVDHHLRQFGT
jgi:hypothetical protein